MPLKLEDLCEVYWVWSPCSVLFHNFRSKYFYNQTIWQVTFKTQAERQSLCQFSANDVVSLLFCCCTILTKILTIIYAVQQDTQSVLMSEFYSALMSARHVSDLTGPTSGAFYTSCIRRLWYVVIRVLFDTSSRYKVVGTTAVLPTTF